MSAVVAPDEEECYLLAILEGADGLDLAEFAWFDSEKDDGCYRAWDFQWAWYTCGDMFQIDQGGRATGKALDLTTPIPTPTGWTSMGHLQIGDQVFDEIGEVCQVVQAHPVRLDRECYAVEFSDGSQIIADAEHLWWTFTKADRKAAPRRTASARTARRASRGNSPRDLRLYDDRRLPPPRGGVRSTSDIAATLMAHTEHNHSIPIAGALSLPEAQLAIDPYLLGVWLGDGTSRTSEITVGTVDEQHLLEEIAKRGYRAIPRKPQPNRAACWRLEFGDVRSRKTAGLQATLRKLNLLRNKHIPATYLRASEPQRREVLAGLVDTDGTVDRRTGRCEISLCSEALALDVLELVTSLGEQPHMTKAPALLNGIEVGIRWRIGWQPRANPALMERKAKLFRQHATNRVTQRRIVAVRRVPTRPVRCITVDSPNGLYLAGAAMVPTHNTVSMKMRAFAFPFNKPGQKMLVTAPELNHLRPIVDEIEAALLTTRLGKEMLPDTKGQGINRQPHWQCRFKNGSQIISRLPNLDGRGVKSMHVIQIELDEAQDYPLAGWTEIIDTLNRGLPGAMWRCHGVSKGIRDKFFELTQEGSGWCLPTGTLVYGVDGPFPIEQAVVGTTVWAVDPDGSLQQDVVTDVLDNGVKATWKVRAKGGLSLETTLNHPYLVLARAGTRRTRRGLAFEWVAAQDVQVGDFIVGVRELDSTGTELPTAEAIMPMLADHSPMREVPEWIWRSPRSLQLAFLAGYAMGDGSRSRQTRGQDAMAFATASERMARQLRALCHYLGLRPTALAYEDRSGQAVSGTGDYWSFYAYVDEAWFWQIPRSYSSVRDGEALQGLDKRLMARRVLASTATGRNVQTFDITVGGRHNYIAEGLVVHNTIHRPMGMHRPTWGPDERDEKIVSLGGSRQSVDYKRNIYGEHGDASNSVFVLAKLMDRIDTDQGSEYNMDVYSAVSITFERLQGGDILNFLDIPAVHLDGYSQIVDRKEMGSPKGYSAYWAGMDVGVTNHPSEILVCGQRHGSDFLELLLRVNMQRINTDDQKAVIERIFEFYGQKLKAFALDKTGVGFPIWDQLTRHPHFGPRVFGYNFSEKVVVAFEDRPLERGEKQEDLAIWRNVVEETTDLLRNDYVDKKRIRLPYDRELLLEFQGQVYCADTETEILTRRGWLRYDQVRAGDETLGLSDVGGTPTSTWTAVRAVNVFPAAARRLVSLEGQSHSSLTTFDHRWLGKPYHHAREMVWRTSDELMSDSLNFRIPLTAQRADPVTTTKFDDDFVELVAWFYTEGHRVPGGKIGFSQSATANSIYVASIEALLTRMLGPGNLDIGRGRHGPGRWSRTTGKRLGAANTYVILDRELCARVIEVAPGRDKVVAPDFLTALTATQLEEFISTSIAADGCAFERERPGKQSTVVFNFAQSHEGRTRAFEMACALAGQATNTTFSEAYGEWRTTLLHRQHSHVSSMRRVVVDSDTVVWCPTTDTGTWLARREGKVFFTGNTVVKDNGTPYGKRRIFSGGSFHTLDAMKMLMGGRHLPQLAEQLARVEAQKPVLDLFMSHGSPESGGMMSF